MLTHQREGGRSPLSFTRRMASSGSSQNIHDNASLLTYMQRHRGEMKRSVASALLIEGTPCVLSVLVCSFRSRWKLFELLPRKPTSIDSKTSAYLLRSVTTIASQVLTILHVDKNFWMHSRKSGKEDQGKIVLEVKMMIDRPCRTGLIGNATIQTLTLHRTK